MSEKSVGVVLPAYRIDREVLRDYIEDIRTIVNPEKIIVELDGDETLELNYQDVYVNYSKSRRGKGRAISEGWDKLGTDLLVFLDADGSIPADSVTSIIDALEDHHLVVGSRKNGSETEVVHETRVRKMLGDIMVLMARNIISVDLNDYQCGAKAMRSDVWNQIERPTSAGFSWDLELIQNTVSSGYNVKEVPVNWYDRSDSTVSLVKTPFEILSTLTGILASNKLNKGKN